MEAVLDSTVLRRRRSSRNRFHSPPLVFTDPTSLHVFTSLAVAIVLFINNFAAKHIHAYIGILVDNFVVQCP